MMLRAIFFFILTLVFSSKAWADGDVNQSVFDVYSIDDLMTVDLTSLEGREIVIQVEFEVDESKLGPNKILDLRKYAQKINLEIRGVCAGECSLLILPITDEIRITESGKIYLTSSLVDTAVMEMSRHMFGESADTSSLTIAKFLSSEQAYIERIALTSKFMSDLALLRRSPHHLIMHSFFLRALNLKVSENCSYGFRFAIDLNENYLENEFHTVKRISESGTDAEEVDEEKLSNFFEELIIVQPYTFALELESDIEPFDRRACFLKDLNL